MSGGGEVEYGGRRQGGTGAGLFEVAGEVLREVTVAVGSSRFGEQEIGKNSVRLRSRLDEEGPEGEAFHPIVLLMRRRRPLC
eukprot:4727699-Pleurochrysis_carterae.AAC.1